jgi:hypothetical protein
MQGHVNQRRNALARKIFWKRGQQDISSREQFLQIG